MICAGVGVGLGGCTLVSSWAGQRWIANYDTAERRMRESDRAMLIWYRDPEPGRPALLKEPLRSREVRDRIRGHVRCVLFKSHEPDRRYVAQFGVERAPALILVHRDGTYHTRVGPLSASEVYRFLVESKPPGARPMINPYVPRQARYAWHDDLETARKLSRETDCPTLIVFYRRLTGDWSMMKELLSRHEVYLRLEGMVHCRIGVWNPWASASATPFGRVKLPAVVLTHSDEKYRVLEMPRSPEALVRFVDLYGNRETGGNSEMTPPTLRDATSANVEWRIANVGGVAGKGRSEGPPVVRSH